MREIVKENLQYHRKGNTETEIVRNRIKRRRKGESMTEYKMKELV